MRRGDWEMGDVGGVGGWILNRWIIDDLGIAVVVGEMGDGETGIKGAMIVVLLPAIRRGDDRKNMV